MAGWDNLTGARRKDLWKLVQKHHDKVALPPGGGSWLSVANAVASKYVAAQSRWPKGPARTERDPASAAGPAPAPWGCCAKASWAKPAAQTLTALSCVACGPESTRGIRHQEATCLMGLSKDDPRRRSITSAHYWRCGSCGIRCSYECTELLSTALRDFLGNFSELRMLPQRENVALQSRAWSLADGGGFFIRCQMEGCLVTTGPCGFCNNTRLPLPVERKQPALITVLLREHALMAAEITYGAISRYRDARPDLDVLQPMFVRVTTVNDDGSDGISVWHQHEIVLAYPLVDGSVSRESFKNAEVSSDVHGGMAATHARPSAHVPTCPFLAHGFRSSCPMPRSRAPAHSLVPHGPTAPLQVSWSTVTLRRPRWPQMDANPWHGCVP